MILFSTTIRLAFTLLVITLLVACAPGQQEPSPEEVAAQVATSVAMTVEAQGQIATAVALTVAAKETELAGALPTPSLEPADTPALTLPTATPFPTATLFVSSGGGGGGGGGSGSAEYACDPDIQKRPFDNSHFHAGETFDIKFTIKNTGTKTWDAGKDLVYFSGPNMITGFPAVIELPEMKPGDLFAVGPYDATAPAEKGQYVMTFKLQGGFCYPYIAINVP